jgi:hypothetical protein
LKRSLLRLLRERRGGYDVVRHSQQRHSAV